MADFYTEVSCTALHRWVYTGGCLITETFLYKLVWLFVLKNALDALNNTFSKIAEFIENFLKGRDTKSLPSPKNKWRERIFWKYQKKKFSFSEKALSVLFQKGLLSIFNLLNTYNDYGYVQVALPDHVGLFPVRIARTEITSRAPAAAPTPRALMVICTTTDPVPQTWCGTTKYDANTCQPHVSPMVPAVNIGNYNIFF